MKKTLCIATGALMSVLLTSQVGAAMDRTAVPGGGTEALKPAAGETGMSIQVRDSRTSGLTTIPIMSTEGADLPVAEVNSEGITVDDLRNAIAGIHKEQDAAPEGGKKAPTINLPELLNRLINAQLIYQEARNIGLDELPEVTGTLDVFTKVTLRSLMREEVWKNITISDAEEDAAFRDAAREVKTSSVFFEKEADAKRMAKSVKAGKSFDASVAEAMKAGTAKGSEMGSLMKVKELDPVIVSALSKMKIGDFSPVKKITLRGKPYYVLFRYEEERYDDSPEAREQASQALLGAKKTRELASFLVSLKKYAVVNTALVESLDYGPKGPGLEKLLQDQRAIVEIKGGQPITVADLSAAMQDKFYHGMKKLAGDKMLKTRRDALEEVVQKRLLLREAMSRGLDQTPQYRNMVKSYKRDIIFGMFVQKVLAPTIRVTDEDLRAYYRDHGKEYLSPRRIKARSLLFGRKEDALAAMEKLKKGADFIWVKANAPGQVAEKSDEEPPFPDAYVAFSSLAEDVQRALEGAASEDIRLYESATGKCYVLVVEDMVAPQQQPFEDIRDEIRPAVFYAKLNESVDEWINKLKQSSDVKVYLADSGK